MSKKMSVKKPVQYYKVVDTENGNHGFFYKLGMNIDPKAVQLRFVGSCEPGALYFTKVESLASWVNYGNAIAWITPVSKVKKDSGENKYKAHKVRVTKILPFKKALPLIKGIGVDQCLGFGISLKEIMKFSNISDEEKAFWLFRGKACTKGEFLMLKPLLKKKSVRKIIAEKEYMIWSTHQTVEILNMGFGGELLNLSTLRELIYRDNKKLILEIFYKFPKKMLEWLFILAIL